MSKRKSTLLRLFFVNSSDWTEFRFYSVLFALIFRLKIICFYIMLGLWTRMASWLCCSSLPSVYQRLGISILRGGHESLLKWSQTFGFMSEDLYFIRVKIIHTRFFIKSGCSWRSFISYNFACQFCVNSWRGLSWFCVGSCKSGFPSHFYMSMSCCPAR